MILSCWHDQQDITTHYLGEVLDLNTRQPRVLAAVLAGAGTSETASTPVTLAASDAADIGALLVKRTAVAPVASSPNAAKGPQPLTSIGDLVGRWNGKTAISGGFTPPLNTSHNIDGSASYDGFSGDFGVTTPGMSATTLAATNPVVSPVSTMRETAIRALSSVGNTRVWNLMIDVVAQTGRFSANASGVNNFAVEGEQRCWMHVAIDRMTGQVVDSKLEVVKE